MSACSHRHGGCQSIGIFWLDGGYSLNLFHISSWSYTLANEHWSAWQLIKSAPTEDWIQITALQPSSKLYQQQLTLILAFHVVPHSSFLKVSCMNRKIPNADLFVKNNLPLKNENLGQIWEVLSSKPRWKWKGLALFFFESTSFSTFTKMTDTKLGPISHLSI